MVLPGLYNEVAHVSTEPTAVSIAAVLTHVLHTPSDVSIVVCTYLLYLLLYLLYAHVQYLRLCSMYYNALPMYVRLHIEKSTDAEYIGTYRTCIMYARTAPTDVLLHELNVDARTYIEEKKIPAAVSTYLPLHVRTYCTYLVLGLSVIHI